MAGQEMLSRRITCDSNGEESSYFMGWKEYERNPYDESKAPTGIIQMGLAENQLSFDLIEMWLSRNPKAANFMNDGASLFRHMALFQDYHGLPSFKKALAEFMAEIRGYRVKFDPNRLVLTAGSTSANETLMFCLAEPGEAFLVPTPYYPGGGNFQANLLAVSAPISGINESAPKFDRDLKWRTGVEIIPVHCHSSNCFQITEASLQEAYHDAAARNMKVKGILVTNPSNPLGTTISQESLKILLSFVGGKGLHLICDEIYSGTVFSSPCFISAAEDSLLQECNVSRESVHIVYSLSKDLGLPGFRVGTIYTRNDHILAAATKMSSFGLVSSQTQYLLSEMLSDKKFTDNYIKENLKRLRRRQKRLVSGLKQCGIGCLESNAGLFCWVDMRHLMESPGFEGEMQLWTKILHRIGLNISPGSSFHCSEPGWFRVCFANMSEKVLSVSLQRVKAFVAESMIHHQERKLLIKQDKSALISRNSTLSRWFFRSDSFEYD